MRALGSEVKPDIAVCEGKDQGKTLYGENPGPAFLPKRIKPRSEMWRCQDQKCGVDCCGDKRSHHGGAFLGGPTPPVHLSPPAVQGRRELGSLTNCSCRFEAALQGQERVTFAQSNFGPDLPCVRLLVWG